MQNLSEIEKRIYNSYLYYSRLGHPVKLRKDFSDMDANTVAFLKKLSLFFSRFPHINIDDFFKAPRILHPDNDYPKLQNFTTLSATKTYSLFKKQEEDEDPEKQTDKIKESFRFIGMFCLENKIPLEKYSTHKTGYMTSWLNHYREHRVNPYSLMELGTLDGFKLLAEDEKALWAGDFFHKIDSYKTRYYNSPKTKQLVREATKKIQDFLKKEFKLTPKVFVRQEKKGKGNKCKACT
jgi:hypothetical protein